MDKKILLEDFGKAVVRLEDAVNGSITTDLQKAGCIQYFEFSFELAWKSIKVIAEEAGLPDCLSPKSAIQQAFAQHWLDDEDTWLSMLAARNALSHTYSAVLALKHFDRLTSYLNGLRMLLNRLKAIK